MVAGACGANLAWFEESDCVGGDCCRLHLMRDTARTFDEPRTFDTFCIPALALPDFVLSPMTDALPVPSPAPATDSPKSVLRAALKLASPRYSLPATPLRSYLIHGAVLLLWLALFVMVFRLSGVLVWSVGVVYVLYDTVLLAFVFWQTLSLAKRQSVLPVVADGAVTGASRVTLGVIVAAHNEAAVLPVTLAALLGQSNPPDEIMIADDGSTDATAAVLYERYGLQQPDLGALSAPSATQPSLRWLRLQHGGKAAALNAAVLQMTSDTVLTVDGDTLLESGAIACVRKAFAAEPALVAATGVLVPVCDASFSGRVLQWFQTYEYIRNFLSRYAWMRVDSLLLISGAFAGFRRQALLEVGGFDADCMVEDYELIHRLRRYGALNHRGWTTRVLGGARALTEAPGTVGTFLRQRQRWFGGFLQTQYWYRDMVGDKRYGWLGLAMLPVKAIDTLQPLYGLTAFFLLVYFIVHGNLGVLAPVGAIIAAKIVVDLLFHIWSVHLYRRWAEGGVAGGADGAASPAHQRRASFGFGLLAALAEPFTFQLLRHTGAAWGWVAFLTGERRWSKQSRGGLLPPG
jgi:cellulose synthase/poly-beta-1,6-N-acetylglucosamine synthase-like glycosyltransferase